MLSEESSILSQRPRGYTRYVAHRSYTLRIAPLLYSPSPGKGYVEEIKSAFYG